MYKIIQENNGKFRTVSFAKTKEDAERIAANAKKASPKTNFFIRN